MELKKISDAYEDLKSAIKQDPNHYVANTMIQNFRNPEKITV